jgi:hypothetical protein
MGQSALEFFCPGKQPSPDYGVTSKKLKCPTIASHALAGLS